MAQISGLSGLQNELSRSHKMTKELPLNCHNTFIIHFLQMDSKNGIIFSLYRYSLRPNQMFEKYLTGRAITFQFLGPEHKNVP